MRECPWNVVRAWRRGHVLGMLVLTCWPGSLRLYSRRCSHRSYRPDMVSSEDPWSDLPSTIATSMCASSAAALANQAAPRAPRGNWSVADWLTGGTGRWSISQRRQTERGHGVVLCNRTRCHVGVPVAHPPRKTRTMRAGHESRWYTCTRRPSPVNNIFLSEQTSYQ
jgi:transposase InsO family protein